VIATRTNRRWRDITYPSALLVAALIVVPALVRATERVSPSSSSTTQFRLVRGFDAPESKFRVASPPRDESPAEIAFEHAASEQDPEPFVAACPEAPPASQLDRSPDALRGPPLSALSL
jgi:hypothetical protein